MKSRINHVNNIKKRGLKKNFKRESIARDETVSQYILINSSSCRMPRTFINEWCTEIYAYLHCKKNIRIPKHQILTIVFFNPSPAKALNFKFRKRNYATDILSFEGDGVESLGELVLCPQVLHRQAQEHDLSFHQELGYMLIHGVLHLLGYDHEKSKKEEKIMFQLQDEIFDEISRK